MPLKKRAIFGIVVTIPLLALLLFAPSHSDSLNHVCAGYLCLFWAGFAYTAWKERRAANSPSQAETD